MLRARFFFFYLLMAAAIACGGKQDPSSGGATGAAGPGQEEALETKGAASEAPPDPAADLPPIPDSPAAAPASLFASLAIGDPQGLVADVGRYVDAVVPGLGSTIGTGIYSDLAREMMKIELAGVDYGKPMWVLMLDPNQTPQPLVLVVAVSDGAALAKSAGEGGLLAQRHGAWAAVGSEAALRIEAAHALSALAAGEPPEKPEATLFVGAIMKRYEAQLQAMLPMIEAQFPAGPDGEPARHFLKGMVKLLSQTEVIRATVEIDASASVQVDVVPRSGSELGEFFAEQAPASFELVGQSSAPAFTLGGRLGWITDGDFLRKMSKSTLGSVYGESASTFEALYELMNGEIAVFGDVDTGGKISFEGRWTVSDLGKAKKLMLGSMRELVKNSRKNKSGHFDYTFRARAFRHARVPVSRVTTEPNKKATAEERAAYESVWGKGAVPSFFAFLDGSTVIAGGAGAGERVKALIDRVKAKDKPSPPAATKAAIEAARTRKETMLLLVDVGALGARLAPGGSGLKAGGDPLAFGVGFDGGKLSLRLTVPAAQAKAFPKLAMNAP